MVWPEEAGIGAAPASRAKAASWLMRPWCDQESTSCAAASGPTPGWSSSCGASLRGERFDLACELALLGGQLQDASRDRARARASCRAALDHVGGLAGLLRAAARSRARVSGRNSAAQRLGCRDQQIAQLAEPGPSWRSRRLPVRPPVPAAPGVHRLPAASQAASRRARCGRRGPRRARRSCRPSGAPGAAGRPRAPARRGR